MCAICIGAPFASSSSVRGDGGGQAARLLSRHLIVRVGDLKLAAVVDGAEHANAACHLMAGGRVSLQQTIDYPFELALRPGISPRVLIGAAFQLVRKSVSERAQSPRSRDD